MIMLSCLVLVHGPMVDTMGCMMQMEKAESEGIGRGNVLHSATFYLAMFYVVHDQIALNILLNI